MFLLLYDYDLPRETSAYIIQSNINRFLNNKKNILMYFNLWIFKFIVL
jgi:hypothetical protein